MESTTDVDKAHSLFFLKVKRERKGKLWLSHVGIDQLTLQRLT